MSCYNENSLSVRPVVRYLSALLITCAMLLAAPQAFALDSGDLIVVSTKGEVHITVNGAARNVRAGGVLELPATLRTGRDGNVELKQGATTVSVGPETLLEFPALEKHGAPIDRIVQPRGNAFYNIGKREGRKLRVETPYLVGVIKGTQFNVAAQDEATTISLFEGLLEVRATDDSDVVDLKAGEIASRKRGDKSISVIKMDGSKAPPTGPRPPAGTGSNSDTPSPTVPRITPSNEGGESLLVDRGATQLPADLDVSTDVRTNGSSVETGVTAALGVGDGVDVTTNVIVNAASNGIDVGAGAAVSLGDSIDVGANAAVNIGPSGADVAATVGVDVGPVTADLGVSAVVDLGAGTVDVSTDVGLDAGPVTADLGTTTNIDLGAGSIDTSIDTSVDAGLLTTDVSTGTGVDLGSGTVDTAVDLGVGTPVVDVDLGAAVGVDAGAGTIDVGLDALGTNIDLGVDLSDTVAIVAPVTETVTETVTDTVVDLGGLLDGLLRRPGRR